MFEALKKLFAELRGKTQASSQRERLVGIDEIPITQETITVSDKRYLDAAAYNDGLLNKARELWRMGEWASLTKLELPNLEQHPDRGKLGLVLASACVQQGDNAAARRYLRHAIDWGCDKRLAAQILTSGVHNTLGRASAIAGDQARMERHFRHAVGGIGSQIERASLGRRHIELQRLGLAQTTCGRDVAAQPQPDPDLGKPIPGPSVNDEQSLSLKEIGIELSDIDSLESRLPHQDLVNEQFDFRWERPTENILIILSTPRSGSTYLSNILHENDLCRPHEYFQLEQYLPILAKRWGCISDNSVNQGKYVHSLLQMRTLNNGWLGIKIHSHHIKTFERFKKFLPKSIQFHYIHLIRRDTLAQAISYEIAEQTEQWSSFFMKNAEPIYNFPSISDKVKQINDGDFFIKTYIKINKLNCTEIHYEDLLGDETPRICEIFQSTESKLKKSQTKKQSSAINELWKVRFQTELLSVV